MTSDSGATLVLAPVSPSETMEKWFSLWVWILSPKTLLRVLQIWNELFLRLNVNVRGFFNDSLVPGVCQNHMKVKADIAKDESSQHLGITCALWSLFSLSSLPLSVIFVSSSASCFLRFSRLSSSSSSLRNSRWLTMGTLTTGSKKQRSEAAQGRWGRNPRGRACDHTKPGKQLSMYLVPALESSLLPW